MNEITFSKNINLLVGHNNAGKSTVLNSILSIQDLTIFSLEDVNLSANNGQISIYFKETDTYNEDLKSPVFRNGFNIAKFTFDKSTDSIIRNIHKNDDGGGQFGSIPNSEPHNLIYPYLSKRKVGYYNENYRIDETNSVTGDFTNLSAKINRISNYSNPSNKEYIEYCEEIIGFPLSTVASPNGQKPAYLVSQFSNIPLSSMGAGVANLVGIIEQLCIAENKIFLIEEPENDIHPKALKALLRLIEKKSANNQFFISTHSNIVTKYLGSVENSKVFKVTYQFNQKIPNSKIEDVPNEETARRELLEELGYEFQDYDLHRAWLFLEESSAEVVIRDFLIPTFAKELIGKLKTFSANGVDKVKPKLEDFNKLFVFLNLQPVYKNKVWTVIDGGEKEETIINDMKEMYGRSGWDKDKFMQLEEHNFEKYYPKSFSFKVVEVLAIQDKGIKRERKGQLIEEVKQWWKDNPDLAKAEFSESAKEVIDILKAIEKQLA